MPRWIGKFFICLHLIDDSVTYNIFEVYPYQSWLSAFHFFLLHSECPGPAVVPTQLLKEIILLVLA